MSPKTESSIYVTGYDYFNKFVLKRFVLSKLTDLSLLSQNRCREIGHKKISYFTFHHLVLSTLSVGNTAQLYISNSSSVLPVISKTLMSSIILSGYLH